MSWSRTCLCAPSNPKISGVTCNTPHRFSYGLHPMRGCSGTGRTKPRSPPALWVGRSALQCDSGELFQLTAIIELPSAVSTFAALAAKCSPSPVAKCLPVYVWPRPNFRLCVADRCEAVTIRQIPITFVAAHSHNVGGTSGIPLLLTVERRRKQLPGRDCLPLGVALLDLNAHHKLK